MPARRIARRRPQTAAFVANRFGCAAPITSRFRTSATKTPAAIAASTSACPLAVRATMRERPASVSPSGGLCQGSPTEISANAPVWSSQIRQRQRLAEADPVLARNLEKLKDAYRWLYYFERLHMLLEREISAGQLKVISHSADTFERQEFSFSGQ